VRRPRLRPLLLALGFVVGLAVGLVTCAHRADGVPLPISTYAGLRAAMERLP